MLAFTFFRHWLKNEKNIKYIKEKLTTYLYPNHDTLSFDYWYIDSMYTQF